MANTQAFTGRAIRVVLADGKSDEIATFKKAFAPDTYPDIIGTATTAEELKNTLSSVRCDAVLLDMGTFGQASALQDIKERHPTVPIIYLSLNPASDTLENIVLRKDATGLVKKNDKTEDLVFAIEAILEGSVESDDASSATNQKLSVREREVLKYLLDAMTTGEIASELHRSLKTISALKESGCAKLGVQSIAGLFKVRDRIV